LSSVICHWSSIIGREGPSEPVTLRYFVGLTLEEAAAALDFAEPTARRWWAYSRVWLLKEIAQSRP
jgi:hypothetical protein